MQFTIEDILELKNPPDCFICDNNPKNTPITILSYKIRDYDRNFTLFEINKEVKSNLEEEFFK